MSNVTQKTEQDVLNELLAGMSAILNIKGNLEELEQLSKVYQRIKSVSTTNQRG